MKKLSFFLMAMLFSVMSFAVEQTATISFADVAQRTTYTTEQQVWEQNGLVVTNDKAAGSNVGDYSNPARFYKNSALTIKCTLGNITKIVVNCNDYKASYPTDLVTSVGAEAVADGTAVTITPTAESDTYSIAALAGQVRVNDITVTYVAAEEEPVVTVPTNAELWEAFKPYYNTFYGEARADQPITAVATFMTKGEKLLTDETSEYKWLGDYLLKVTNEQIADGTLKTYTGITTEVKWRFATQAFFNCSAAKDADYSGNADFTEAGKPENWGPYYLAAQTPVEPAGVTYNVTVPAGTFDCYIVGEMTGWSHTQMTKVDDTHYTITLADATKAMGYKYCSGPDWKYVEKGASGEELENRVYSESDVVATWAAVYNPNASVEPDATWTVAGAPATVFGSEWDPANTANDMRLQDDGTYVWEKTDLTLAASNIQFKVAKNHAWDEAYPSANYDLAIAEAGIYTITITFNPATQEVVGTATKTGDAVVIPTIAIAGDMNGWNTTANEFVVSEDELTASLTLSLEAQDYGFKMIIAGGWTSDGATITRENNTVVFTGANGDNSTLTADVAGDYTFTWTYATNTLVVTYPEKPAIEWIEMPLEISNLTTMEMPVEGVTYLQLTGRDDMNDADVMLFLNNYTGEEKAYEVNAESSFMTFGGMELTVMDGSITKSVDPELGDVYAGIVHASVEEEGATMYVAFDLKMYALAPIAIELEDVEIVVNEESAIAFFNATWEGSPLQVEVSGFEEVEFKEYPECWLSIGDDVNWVDAAAGPAAIIIEDGVAMLEGEFTSFSTGKTYEVMLSGTLPVKEEPVVEPTYTENNLNPYAFGLESVLSDDKTTLTVTYRLNNSNATSVNVLVYNGEDIVASIPGTTTIGKNTVEVATGNLPAGVELKWAVEVNGTSVEAPTQDEKMFSLYCPHGLAIDTDPESENFGRILVAEAMQGVPASGYVTSGKGAGLYVFNPSFTTDSVVYTGGNDFTRILASNGYQPWRVKISEDGRIFVSSLDLNGVVVWEVSKDLQTWTPVIAGTNDATDHNIYDAEGNFVAGLNCSMDVIGSGEDLKLLLYSTNNKGIAFNQSGYRLDEYALGTATTWTGTPKNILEGGKLGLVHTNVEFIYDGEGGYWFGASRAGNAGQPNLVHINAAGEQDYYTEDASLYGGDGVLVHNGMLFKGKARTSSTVGNFGVWTIGKDADGKVTLTEKWTVEANGIGRNLNEFAVDYAENLYIVGNSGEKIIAYALPYSGRIETPAAAKYAFQLPEPLKMAGVVKRAVQNGDAVIVLTHEENGAAHIYQVVDGKAVAEVSLEGVLPVDTENLGSYLAISDIAVTEDGKLVANNYNRCSFNDGVVESGYKRGTLTFYIWNDLAAAPAIWFQSKASSNSNNSDQGYTMALTGTSTNANILVSGVHNTQRGVRMSHFSVVDGVFEDTQDGAANLPYYYYIGSNFKGASAGADAAVFNEQTQGANLQFHASPLADENWIIDGELTNPIEFTNPQVHGGEVVVKAALTEDLGKKYNGATYVTVGEKVLMVAPFANPDGELVGAEILNITNGFDAPQYVDMVYVDEAVAATAAATAVEVVEGGLNITLVADNAIHTWFVEMSEGPVYEVYEEEITNLVIDLDNLVLMGGPGSAFQVEVYLPLGEYNMSEDSYQLTSESSIAVLGSDATFIEGYAYEVDAFTPSAKAVVRCEWNGMLLEFRLTMTAAPLEPTVVVVENAAIEIEKYLLWGDMYDYALKMSGEWVNPEDGLTYPVLVEVPVYYPEATEPSEIMSTVTVGGWDDDDPWLGFGEGTLTVTTETLSAGDKLITATGIVQNPMAGVAIDITISGSITPTGVENATVTVKSVKMIQNGQLIIKKGDAQYNAQGAMVK